MYSNISAVILAAGKGTRMKSAQAKVLHEVFFQPMLHHVLNSVRKTGIQQIAVIVGHQREKVLASITDYPVTPVVQREQLGTGHAVLCAEQACTGCDHVLILCGDTPLIRPETLEAMMAEHVQTKSTVTLMTTCIEDPFGYGRILSNDAGNIVAIVEEKDAMPAQKVIKEINAGIYLVQQKFLFSALQNIGTDNSQGEVYLTDIIAITNEKGGKVHKFIHPQAIDVLGVNSRIELAEAHQELQTRHNTKLMLSGVTMYTPESILIAPSCSIKRDTSISAGVQITGDSTIGCCCRIEAGAQIHGCQVADNAVIGGNAVLHNCTIERSEHIPPLTYRVG